MDLRQLDALLAPLGQDLLHRAAALLADGEGELRTGELLRRDHPEWLVAAALTQLELRARARAKFDRADEMFFTRAGLEQASSQAVAEHRARRFADRAAIADLCTGVGGDLAQLARSAGAARIVAVDRDEVHARIARHNAGVYSGRSDLAVLVDDVRAVDPAGFDAVFVDPARRGDGAPRGDSGRLPPGQSEPPLPWCLDLADRVPAVAIKAAPGLPHSLIPVGWEAEFVAEGRDLKEAVLWSPAFAAVPRRATVLPGGHELLPRDGPDVPVGPPGAYLVDPNPAVTRAGLVEELARRLGAWKIDPRIAFLCADEQVSTPFGRTLPVHASLPWRERDVAAELRRLHVGSVDIRRRGLAGDVDRARRAFRLTGARRALVAMTRVDGRPWALICVEP